MPFSGFPRDGVAFFKQLGARQDRDWFKANKQLYVDLWEAPMKALVDDIGPRIAKQYNGARLDKPKVFRIYRDVRFAKDKSPFKTNAAAMIGFAGGEEVGAPAALYMHFGLEDVAAAGHWTLPSDKLQRFRNLVADGKHGAELAKKVAALEKKGFTVSSFEALKRVPKGFDPEHPRGRLLKLKGMGFEFPKVPSAVRFSPKLAGWLTNRSAEVAPLITWLEAKL